MSEDVAIFGYGAVGRATAEHLSRLGHPMRVMQREAPRGLPAGARFHACDVLDRAAVREAVGDAGHVVLAVGLPYDGAVWKDAWPRIMTNLVEVCADTGARLIFIDNLYMYGPQTEPLTETMELTSFGVKPKARADVTRTWVAATGRVRVAALRAPDFYGPAVGNSHLGDLAFGALAQGKTATFIGSPDIPHDFAYVPDIARGVASLIDAPDDAYGQAWHIPCAPTRSRRDILSLGATALGLKPNVRSIPLWSLPALGLFVPIMREIGEMRFQWDRPYHVNHDRFAKRFWSDATPFEIGAVETLRSFREAAVR